MKKLSPMLALLVLCLLWAAATLRIDLFPRAVERIELSPIARESSLLGIFVLLAALAALMQKPRWPQRGICAEAMLVGFGLFVVPLLLTEFGKTQIPDSTRVALFSLTPFFAAVFEPYLSCEMKTPRSAFQAAMIAVAGTVLVFPIAIPHSAVSSLAFCGFVASAASIAAANCLGVRATQQSNDSSLPFAIIATATASVFLGALAIVIPFNKASFVFLDAWTALDLIALALLFWLMRRMSAVRMTTRFLIAPLLANLAGLAIIRPNISWQALVGLLLIAIASGWLLFGPNGEREASGTLGID